MPSRKLNIVHILGHTELFIASVNNNGHYLAIKFTSFSVKVNNEYWSSNKIDIFKRNSIVIINSSPPRNIY